MAIKHSLSRRSLSNHSTQKQLWYQIFLVLALVPLLVGILLILTALTGALVRPTAWEQAIIGSLYILTSFVLSNVLQKQWKLMLGWLLLGAAIWLGLNWAETGVRILAAAMAGGGIALIFREFLRRRQQYLAEHGNQKFAAKRSKQR
ncbi:MAG: hypothetical protein FOGNACKC_04953 [Anaerolineae bacterium]|nr:hypothetical protein [Anaerolineae bacterium]